MTVGYLASYWNIPMFPEYCSDVSMDDKLTYNTMVRVGGSWTGTGKAFVWVMKTYGWRHAVLLTVTAVSGCSYGGEAVPGPMDDSNMTLYWIRMMPSPSDSHIDDYLTQTRDRARGI